MIYSSGITRDRSIFKESLIKAESTETAAKFNVGLRALKDTDKKDDTKFPSLDKQ